MKMRKTKVAAKAFTLIELMVVISIISFMSSIALASLNTARANSRDTERASNAKQISNAMEMYYDDNKAPPPSLDALVPKYLPKVPANFSYASTSNASGFLAVAYTTYETRKVMDGSGSVTFQKVGASVTDTGQINVCGTGWAFPTCVNGSSVDQIINVTVGKQLTSISCSSPFVINSSGTACVCPSGTTAQYSMGVLVGCTTVVQGGGGLGGGGIKFP